MSPCTLLYQVWSLESLMAILCQPVLTLASNAVSEERPVNIDIAMRYNGGSHPEHCYLADRSAQWVLAL